MSAELKRFLFELSTLLTAHENSLTTLDSTHSIDIESLLGRELCTLAHKYDMTYNEVCIVVADVLSNSI